MLDVDRHQILAFRLSRHHLIERLPAGSMIQAVAAAGIQETPRQTASLALHARVADVSLAELDQALKQDKTLLTIWSLRGAPYLVPTQDAAVFTSGAKPTGGDSWKAFFGGWADSLSVPLEHLVEQTAEVARVVLDGRQLEVDALRQEIARRMKEIRDLDRPSGAHADLPEPLFRAMGQLGIACIADTRRMTDALLARTDQWLGKAPAPVDQDIVQAELLRRYLRCYGPASHQSFAEWTLRSLPDVRAIFELIEPELVQVNAKRRPTEWLLASDVEAATSPPEPTGVRLIPAQDPFLQQRDRDRLLPDRDLRRRLWRPVGAPGLVLVDGQPKGVWTSQRRGKSIQFTVDPFDRITAAEHHAIAAEADSLAPLREAERTTLVLKT